jgi:hypothetical protein
MKDSRLTDHKGIDAIGDVSAQETRELNLRRGLFRIWITGSIAWVAFTIWHSPLARDLSEIFFSERTFRFTLLWSTSENIDQVLWIIGPPFAVLLAALSLRWIAKGFRRK